MAKKTVAVEEVTLLDREDEMRANKAVIRLCSTHIDGGRRPGCFPRMSVVRIKNIDSGRVIYREVAGSGAKTSVPVNGIACHYDDLHALGVVVGAGASLEISQAHSVLGSYLFNWFHPDKATRFATRFGTLAVAESLLLGSIGIWLGVLSTLG